MSATQAWFGHSAWKFRWRRFGATPCLWLLSVVFRNLRPTTPQIPCCCMSRAIRWRPTSKTHRTKLGGHPETSVASTTLWMIDLYVLNEHFVFLFTIRQFSCSPYVVPTGRYFQQAAHEVDGKRGLLHRNDFVGGLGSRFDEEGH